MQSKKCGVHASSSSGKNLTFGKGNKQLMWINADFLQLQLTLAWCCPMQYDDSSSVGCRRKHP